MQLSNSVGATLTPSSRSTSSSKNSLTNLGISDFVPNGGNSPPLSSKSANRSQKHSGNTTCSSTETYQSHSSRTASNQTTFSSNSRNYQNSQNSSHTSNNSTKKAPSTHLNQYEAVQCNPAPMDAPKEASRVLPFLWQGSLENAKDPVFSKDAKITHIVNVSTFTYDLPSTVHPQNYLQIAVLDAFGAHLAPYLDKCVRFLKTANRLYEDTNGETGSCLVHCQAGISRSSIVSIAFLMNHRHMGWEPAKNYLKERRYFINPNMNFAGELVTYEKLLIERGVINKNGADVVSISGFSLSHSRKSSTVSNFEGKSRQKSVDHNEYIKHQNEKHKKPSNTKKPSRPKFLKLLCVNTEKNDPTDNMVEKIAKSEKKLRNHELGKVKSDAESVSSNAPTSAPRSKPSRPSGLSINCLGKVRRPKPSSLNIKRNQNSSYNNFQQITDEVLSSTPVNDKDSVGKNSLGKNSLGRNSDKISVSGESNKESSGGGSGLCGMKAGAKVAMKNVRKSLKLPIVRHQDSSNSEKFPSPNECDVHSGRLHSTSKTVESSGSSKSSKRNSNFGLNLSRLKPTRTSPKPSSPKAGSLKTVESQKRVQIDKSSQKHQQNQNSWLPVGLQKRSDSPDLMENSKVRNSQVRNSKISQVRASPKVESENSKFSSEIVARESQSVSRSSSFHCKNHSPIGRVVPLVMKNG